MSDHSIGVRVQRMPPQDQVLVLARIAETRAGSSGYLAPRHLAHLFLDLSLPAPAKISNVVAALKLKGYLTSGVAKGHWKLTPLGRGRSAELLSEIDLAALAAEAASETGPVLGAAVHMVIPPVLAPPALLPSLRRFLAMHPFETNVFGMTRFPEEESEPKDLDPVGPALDVARDVCESHGLQFHLASDSAIDDDLWTNVAAHMWASRYGIAFFEDRRGRGMNYNLTIEVGGMLITGRRCALLRDKSIDRTPTDLVGRIYKAAGLDDLGSIRAALHTWIRDDLGLEPCAHCR